MTQVDLWGNPVRIIGKKDPDGVRSYPFLSNDITVLNSLNLKTGVSKQELMAEGIRALAIVYELFPKETVKRMLDEGPQTMRMVKEIHNSLPKEIRSLLSDDDLDLILKEILSMFKTDI